MEYKDIKLGDVVYIGDSIKGRKGIVVGKSKPRISIINEEGIGYSVMPRECEKIVKRGVDYQSALKALIND